MTTLTKTLLPWRRLDERIESAMCIRPAFMPKDEFEVLLHRKVLDAADSEILAMVEPLTTIRRLGQAGALELLMKIGLVLSELDIPSADQDDEDVLTQEKREGHE